MVVDRYGHGVHLGERDCSVQRRHQKLIEEAPTPALPEAARAELAERAIRAVVAAGYENLGTLEFLVDRDQSFYFIEINCRIQVEHPVTEMLTGIDLVATQLRIAAGEPLGFSQADVTFRGHAIEFRINAEDAAHDFRSQRRDGRALLRPRRPGRADGLPPVRRLRGARPTTTRCSASSIVWGPDRPSAIARGRAALDELVVDGVDHQPRLPPRHPRQPGVRRGPRDDEPHRPRRRGRLPGPARELSRRPVQPCIHLPARRPRAAGH